MRQQCSDITKKEGVSCVLIGGFAVNYYKVRLAKDLPDVINLIRINAVDIDGTEFKEMCLKYGNKDIYEKITEALK